MIELVLSEVKVKPSKKFKKKIFISPCFDYRLYDRFNYECLWKYLGFVEKRGLYSDTGT